MSCSLFTHRYFQFVRFNEKNRKTKKRRNWNRQRVFFLPAGAHAACKQMIGAMLQYLHIFHSLSCSVSVRRAESQTINWLSGLSVYIRSSTSGRAFAEHTMKRLYRCECLCYDVITWFHRHRHTVYSSWSSMGIAAACVNKTVTTD